MAQGYTVNRLIAAGTTNATLVIGRPAQVTGWYLYNAAAYAVFLKLYDQATAPTAGQATGPKMTIGIPAGAGANVDFESGPTAGIAFSSGLGFTITKLAADNDTTVVVAGDLIVNLLWV